MGRSDLNGVRYKEECMRKRRNAWCYLVPIARNPSTPCKEEKSRKKRMEKQRAGSGRKKKPSAFYQEEKIAARWRYFRINERAAQQDDSLNAHEREKTKNGGRGKEDRGAGS